jgi:fatty-acid desaturase
MVLDKSRYVTSSVDRYFGSRRFATADESRNVPWLAPASFGESCHDNHDAFPRSYRHGPRRHELDISALVVAGLEKVGLAWDVPGGPHAHGRQDRSPSPSLPPCSPMTRLPQRSRP